MKRILLTRQKSVEDKKFFENKGYECQILPLSKLVLRELSVAEIAELNQSTWLIFTSQTPVQMILSHLKTPIKIACIGKKTADEIRKYGYTPDFIAQDSTKTKMLADWQAKYAEQGQVFYPMSNLAESIAPFKNVICYDNQAIPENMEKLKVLLENRQIDAVYLTSPSAWHRFYQLYKDYNYPLEIICIGTTTQVAIEKTGYKATIKEI